MNSPSTVDFYARLPAFDNFRDVANPEHYQPLPADWSLLVSDVVGSTIAIEKGKYRAVNMVGAASIIAALNVAGDVALPFAFGGDGSLLALPPELLQAACRETRLLQAASLNLFGLPLRAAAIPVSALRSAGADTLVAKHRLSKNNHLAMFAGDGASVADQWLKDDTLAKPFLLQDDDSDDLPNLEGLSCRWQPLKSRNGTMLTLILLPHSACEENGVVSALNDISKILGGRVSDFAPAHDATLRFRYPPAGLPLEISAGAGRAGRIKRTSGAYFTALMQYFCESYRIKIGDYDGAVYREELKSNTDFRKYDGALRMVLDVSVEQAGQIEAFLEREYRHRHLIYGIWKTERALMTCLLFNLAESRHVHLIDGADGGYAMAAKGLKRRIRECSISAEQAST